MKHLADQLLQPLVTQSEKSILHIKYEQGGCFYNGFQISAYCILQKLILKNSRNVVNLILIFSELSESELWFPNTWMVFYGNTEKRSLHVHVCPLPQPLGVLNEA